MPTIEKAYGILADDFSSLQEYFDANVGVVQPDYFLVLKLPCDSLLKFKKRDTIKHKDYKCSCGCENYFIKFKDIKDTVKILINNIKYLTKFDILDI